MPSRRDEWLRGRAADELRYCVVCEQYLAPAAWADHEHNPELRAPGASAVSFLDELTSDVMYLGGVKVANCSSILVLEGVEVFRLRDRDSRNHIRVDLDVRGPQGKRLAVIADNQPRLLAPGFQFIERGPICAVVDEASEKPVVTVEALSSKAVRLLGTLWVENVQAVFSPEGLTLGGVALPARPTMGKGTAVLLRKSQTGIGFAKR